MTHRELFRGKGLSDGQWHYGDLATSDHHPKDTIIEDTDFYPVDPVSVGEYIRRADADGIDIYEGDIISFYDQLTATTYVGRVTFAYSAFAVENGEAMYSRWADYDKIHILGNISDNPYLEEALTK